MQTIVLRAGNFIDPNGNGDLMSLMFMRDIAKDRLMAAGDPSAMQAYAYVPDWARAAVHLANMRDQLAPFEDVPFPGNVFTADQLRASVADALGRPVRLSQFPWWAMTALAPFWEFAREMREMRYLYSMPHSIGSAKFARLLPDFVETEMASVMRCGLPRDVHPDKMMHTRGQTVAAQ